MFIPRPRGRLASSPGCCPGELLAGTRIGRKVRLHSQRFGLADRLPVHTNLPRRGAAVQLRFQRPGDRTGADRDESPTVCGQGAADSRSARRIKRRRRSPPCRLQVLTASGADSRHWTHPMEPFGPRSLVSCPRQ
jgi:hypothetical protein